ncbi:YtxH domain-containing protein [Hymenobacter perfusus]|uniref:YtxH domain-containing protein n=1 Tax=Hymenobacter perfusus TaxID=1236770 RepID=A0A428K7V9_9BACT|nr:YtxH domain-containing protein [Hymenobacter perfusus]RSK42485.1 YtxH domain-containing protein [Hymenobacter perfusus]
MQDDTKGKVILSLLVGATAGIVAGLLLAPETGDETRSGLKKSASKLSDDLNKLFQEGKSRLASLKDQAPADSEQHTTDRASADDLLSSMNQPAAGPANGTATDNDTQENDSDYDGIGGDTRHFPGYKAS